MIIFLSSCSSVNEENHLNDIQKQEVQIKQEIKQEIKEEEKKEIFIENSFDDSSISKFVSAKIWFTKNNYIPENLVSISSPIIIDAKQNQLLRIEAKNALDNMAKDFYEKFSKELIVVSAYRSYLDQKKIKDNGCPDNFCAKVWFSEHQTWLAIDFFEATNKDQFLSNPNYKMYFEWLSENAYKYGFHNSYQKWLEIDTYEIEPWHWRYLWIELATKLKQNNLTYAEYINLEEIKNKK